MPIDPNIHITVALGPFLTVRAPSLDCRPLPHAGPVTAAAAARWRGLAERWTGEGALPALAVAELLGNAVPALLAEVERQRVALADGRDVAFAFRDQAVALLREVEWGTLGRCPYCGRYQPGPGVKERLEYAGPPPSHAALVRDPMAQALGLRPPPPVVGHAPDCRLSAFLGTAP